MKTIMEVAGCLVALNGCMCHPTVYQASPVRIHFFLPFPENVLDIKFFNLFVCLFVCLLEKSPYHVSRTCLKMH